MGMARFKRAMATTKIETQDASLRGKSVKGQREIFSEKVFCGLFVRMAYAIVIGWRDNTLSLTDWTGFFFLLTDW